MHESQDYIFIEIFNFNTQKAEVRGPIGARKQRDTETDDRREIID